MAVPSSIWRMVKCGIPELGGCLGKCTEPPRIAGGSRQLRRGIRQNPLLSRLQAAIFSWWSQHRRRHVSFDQSRAAAQHGTSATKPARPQGESGGYREHCTASYRLRCRAGHAGAGYVPVARPRRLAPADGRDRCDRPLEQDSAEFKVLQIEDETHVLIQSVEDVPWPVPVPDAPR